MKKYAPQIKDIRALIDQQFFIIFGKQQTMYRFDLAKCLISEKNPNVSFQLYHFTNILGKVTYNLLDLQK